MSGIQAEKRAQSPQKRLRLYLPVPRYRQAARASGPSRVVSGSPALPIMAGMIAASSAPSACPSQRSRRPTTLCSCAVIEPLKSPVLHLRQALGARWGQSPGAKDGFF